MKNVAVIGAGAMGLAAAHHAAKAGHKVVVFEADKVAGGMAAHFDFGGLSIERYYHFVCKPDAPTFELMGELGIADRMRWKRTTMGYFVDGRLHDWGNPVALLRFPGLSLIEKLRYGLMMFTSVKRGAAGDLENRSARDWIVGWCGRSVYERMWKPLLDLKFYEHADNISAAWMWTRIKRLGSSRSSMMHEQLGWIDGGSQTLVDALVASIESKGGQIRLGAPAQEIRSADGRVTGVVANGEFEAFDEVICTVPTPFVSAMVPGLPQESRRAYEAIENIGVVCLIFKLKRSLTPHFWVNVSDRRIAIPGFVEFSNLRPTGETIVYVPYYMPTTNPNWAKSDEQLANEAFSYLKTVQPDLQDSDRLDWRAGRLRHAQPVCPPGFAAHIPPVRTPIAGLQIADTCFYYPEDRGVSEGVRYGKLMARAIDDPTVRVDAR